MTEGAHHNGRSESRCGPSRISCHGSARLRLPAAARSSATRVAVVLCSRRKERQITSCAGICACPRFESSLLEKGISVPSRRRTSYAAGLSKERHSASVSVTGKTAGCAALASRCRGQRPNNPTPARAVIPSNSRRLATAIPLKMPSAIIFGRKREAVTASRVLRRSVEVRCLEGIGFSQSRLPRDQSNRCLSRQPDQGQSAAAYHGAL